VYHQTLTDGDNTLLGTRDRALEHEEVVLDDTVVREAAERCDGLVRGIGLGACVGSIGAETDTVDLLVELGTVVVSVCSFVRLFLLK
jgi:hypothetical protein